MQGSIGGTATMCGGKCNGKTLSQMDQSGWKLTEVIGGLKGGFGMLFTK